MVSGRKKLSSGRRTEGDSIENNGNLLRHSQQPTYSIPKSEEFWIGESDEEKREKRHRPVGRERKRPPIGFNLP